MKRRHLSKQEKIGNRRGGRGEKLTEGKQEKRRKQGIRVEETR